LNESSLTPTPLAPLLLPSSPRPTIDSIKEEILGARVTPPQAILVPTSEEGKESWREWILKRSLMLGVKGSIHITLISIFETIFFFLYVSRSENTGILKTLDVYYQPILTQCYSWSPTFRSELLDILEWAGAANQTAVDAAGAAAAAERSAENLHLLWISLAYIASCIGIGGICITILIRSKRVVKWRELVGEHIFFVIILGFYEWFFFHTIIYNYNTLSTPELNQYLANGIYDCLA
jgi:hypothetical protein